MDGAGSLLFFSVPTARRAEGRRRERPARKLLHLARGHVALDQGAETQPHPELEGGEVLRMRSLNYTPFSNCLQLLLWPETT